MAGDVKTRQDLILEVLARIGALSPGQPTDPEDYSYVDNSLDPILLMLDGLEIVTVPDTTQIPGQWFVPLADIVAGECCTKFGVTSEDYTILKTNGLGGVTRADGTRIKVGDGVAAQALRAIRRLAPTGEVLRIEYF